MKTCLVYGNCQIVAIKSLLLQNLEFSNIYRFVELNPVFLLTPEDAPHLKKLVSEIDLFIHQPVSAQYKGKELSTDYLRSLVKENAQIISIPVSYFTGYNPELFYLKDQEGIVIAEPFPYHDRNILSLYLQGKTIQETIQLIQSDDFYTLEQCQNNLDQTLSNLAMREEEQKLDVQLTSFIQKNFERYRLFHTFDHPSVAIIAFIAQSILKLLEIGYQKDFNSFFDRSEMLDDYIFPIYPSLGRHLKLQFESSSNYQCAFKKYHPEEVVESFFRFYEQYSDWVKMNLE